MQITSPCVDAGTNAFASSLDLDGKTRIQGPSSLVDMGCYEYIPEPGLIGGFILLALAFLRRK